MTDKPIDCPKCGEHALVGLVSEVRYYGCVALEKDHDVWGCQKCGHMWREYPYTIYTEAK